MADLTTLKDVKTFLDNMSKEHDALLNTLLSAVTAEIEAWLGRTIVQATATDERLTVCVPSSVAQTRNFPIISIASLTESGTSLVLNTNYEIEPCDKERGQIVRISGVDGDPIQWSRVKRTIKLTYDHGYATVPKGIAKAAIDLVASDFYASIPSKKARFGIRSRSMATGEDVTFLTRDEVWKQQLSRLAPFRRLAA